MFSFTLFTYSRSSFVSLSSLTSFNLFAGLNLTSLPTCSGVSFSVELRNPVCSSFESLCPLNVPRFGLRTDFPGGGGGCSSAVRPRWAVQAGWPQWTWGVGFSPRSEILSSSPTHAQPVRHAVPSLTAAVSVENELIILICLLIFYMYVISSWVKAVFYVLGFLSKS